MKTLTDAPIAARIGLPRFGSVATRLREALRALGPRRVALIAGGLLVVVLIVALGVAGASHRASGWHRATPVTPTALAPAVALPAPDALRPLTPQEAIAENSKRAAVARPDQPAAAFRPKFASDDTRARALECMTQAIYYEAASEPLAGREAVAQVILNRLHHPAFPGSVCGVVYQGAERSTGCQFTFACDGSLRRTPAAGLWNQARKVAIQALAGRVFAPVGHATHYHADYVLPYWADSLDKEIQIGRHIFYRLRGGLGAAHTFSQAYRGQEPAPPSPADVLVAATAIEAASGAAPGNPLTGAGTERPKAPPILADLAHGKLLVDEAPPFSGLPAGPKLAATATPCPIGKAPTASPAQPDERATTGLALDCR